MYRLSMYFIGVLFGIGLTVANMTNPYKVLNFLDVFGDWDPTLLVVMFSALLTTFIGYHFILKLEKPKFSDMFYLPENSKITPRLIIGSMIFGIGWGIGGYCPGPGLTALATFALDPLLFVLSMIGGSFVFWMLYRS